MDTNKLYWIGGGVAVLLLAGGAYWYYTSQRAKDSESKSLTVDLSKVAGDGAQIKVNLPQSVLKGTTDNTGIAGDISKLTKDVKATMAAKV